MKKRTLILGALPVLGLLAAVGFSASAAMAHGPGFDFGRSATPDEIASRQTQMFQREADLLGLTVDEVKDAWADGKTMKQLMAEKGITQDQIQAKLKAQRDVQMKTQLQGLVEKGIITQAQADKRLVAMGKTPDQGRGRGLGIGMRMGMGSGGFRR
jgi:hypothetical protein